MQDTRSSRDELTSPINEIEHFILRHRVRQLFLEYNIPTLNMVTNHNLPLKDYAPPFEEEPHSSIAPPAIEANNFELKPSLLQAVQQN